MLQFTEKELQHLATGGNEFARKIASQCLELIGRLEGAESGINLKSKVNHITEIIPNFSKLPDWAREAFKDGRYFAVVSAKIIEYETLINDYKHASIQR